MEELSKSQLEVARCDWLVAAGGVAARNQGSGDESCCRYVRILGFWQLYDIFYFHISILTY